MTDENIENPETEENTEQQEEQRAPIDQGLAVNEDESFKWYIAKTATGKKTKSRTPLKERIVNHKLTDFFSRILIPEETVVTNTGGKKRTIKRNFSQAIS